MYQMKFFNALALFAILALTFTHNKALADQSIDGFLRIKVTIIQCGSMDFMNDSCRKNQACCHFVDTFDDEDVNAELPEPTAAPLPLFALSNYSLSDENENFSQE